MKSLSFPKKLIISLFFLLIILFAALTLYQKSASAKVKKEFIDRLASESYDSVFFSMYSIENYSIDNFVTYRGVNPIISSHVITDLSDLSDYLNAALASGNTINNVYLGLDPEALLSVSKNNVQLIENLNQQLLPYFTNYPDISFEILFAYPSIDYWTDQSSQQISALTDTITTVVQTFAPFSNVIMFFPGAEEWLISNPANYSTPFETTPYVSDTLMRLAFCDRHFVINSENINHTLTNFTNLILAKKETDYKYPDLSDWHVVFFGDSVIGNYSGSLSIPGVMNGISGASVYNYGKGGTPASDFLNKLDAFLSHTLDETTDGTVFPYDSVEASEDKLCFVIHYGLNDYFSGARVDNAENPYDTGTYAGSIRTGIKRLQEAYPNARIILMPPPFTYMFSYGEEVNSPEGSVLSEYVDVTISIAKDMDTLCLDSYYDLGMTKDNQHIYLADGCHYNEYGRYITGLRLVSLFEK